MKMVKKILLGLVATAAVLALASCKMGAGEGETEGNKWDLTMTVDATESAKTPLEEGKTYRRFWKQFSTSEKVAEITTTITIDMAEQVYTSGAFVSGLIFDLNKNATDDKLVDFNLIGVNPNKKEFYVERYTGISKQDKESLDSSEGSLVSALPTPVAAKNLETVSWTGKESKKGSFGYALTDKMYSVSDKGVVTCVVTISQTNKKYSVKLGDVTVAEYDASASTNTWSTKKDKKDVEYAVGGIACYGNAGKGNKLVVNYTTDKETVTGKLEAEEIEE